MNKILNVIRKQNVLVELNGTEADGLALQRRMTVLCEQMPPLFERVLDHHDVGESQVHIDRIDIDIGPMTVESLERELPKAVTGALDKFLREHLPAGESPRPFVSGNVQRTSTQTTIYEVFLYFLKTGSLPWSFHIPVDETLEHIISVSWQEAEKANIEPISNKGSLLQALSSATVRKRLIRQFSSGFLDTLVSFLSPEVKRVIAKVLPRLLQADIPSAIKEAIIQRIWETVFFHISARQTVTAADIVQVIRHILPATGKKSAISDTLEHIVTQSIKGTDIGVRKGIDKGTVEERRLRLENTAFDDGLVSEESIDKGHMIEKQLEAEKSTSDDGLLSEEGMSESPGDQRLPRFKESASDDRLLSAEGISESPGDQRLPKVEKSISDDELTSKKNIKEGLSEERNIKVEKPTSDDGFMSEEHPDAPEGIYIGNAGLVILHQFLPQFFSALGIVLEGRLVQPGRALCLLYFLATGQSVTPEYELVLPKILCGVPLLTPVETRLELTEPEKEEATTLLKSVIHHWEALRDTSPDGLRGSFLLRKGKVSLREDGTWLLQVEPNSMDILMEQLPWGISMIKLPWMKTWLHVEWRQ